MKISGTSLISTLQESADIAVSDLKKRIAKDKRVAVVLNGDFDSIRNPAEFLRTLKFLVLNNRNVIEFVKERSNVNALSSNILKGLRELTPPKFTEPDFSNLQNFLKDLFKEATAVNSLNLSGAARKELVEWANANGRYFNLTSGTQRELLSIPGLRPEKPIVLYRGLLFSSYDLKERKRYDGELEIGKGLKFLREIRKGTRVIDLEWEKPSSWTKDVKTAEQFARFGPASSSYSATLQWLSRKGHIDGDLGFIISYLAKPEDVLIDMAKFKTAAHLQHGDEGEVILRPGIYTCRVHTKFTPKGPVDPVASDFDSQIDSLLLQQVQSFSESYTLDDLEELRLKNWFGGDLDRYLSHGTTAQLKLLLNPDTKSALLKKYEELQEFYRNTVKNIDLADLHSVSSREQRRAIEFLIELKASMETEHSHKDHRSVENPKGKFKAHLMTPQQVRDSKDSLLAKTVRDLGRGMRFTDFRTGRDLGLMAKFAGVEVPPELHRKSGKIQSEAVQEVCTKFLRKIGFAAPDALAEVTEKTANVLLAGERNIELFSKIRNAVDALKRLEGDEGDE